MADCSVGEDVVGVVEGLRHDWLGREVGIVVGVAVLTNRSVEGLDDVVGFGVAGERSRGGWFGYAGLGEVFDGGVGLDGLDRLSRLQQAGYICGRCLPSFVWRQVRNWTWVHLRAMEPHSTLPSASQARGFRPRLVPVPATDCPVEARKASAAYTLLT